MPAAMTGSVCVWGGGGRILDMRKLFYAQRFDLIIYSISVLWPFDNVDGTASRCQMFLTYFHDRSTTNYCRNLIWYPLKLTICIWYANTAHRWVILTFRWISDEPENVQYDTDWAVIHLPVIRHCKSTPEYLSTLIFSELHYSLI